MMTLMMSIMTALLPRNMGSSPLLRRGLKAGRSSLSMKAAPRLQHAGLPSNAQAPAKFKPYPFAYHTEVELKIDSLSNSGEGVGRVHIGDEASTSLDSAGWVVMVPFTVPGEVVRARIYRNHDRYSQADLISVIEESAHRCKPVCDLFATCGGCQYQMLSYDLQLEWKSRQVATMLERIGGLDADEADALVQPTVASPKQLGYRSKLTPHYAVPRNAHPDDPIAIVFLATASKSQLVDVQSCPIATSQINSALPAERERLLSRLRREQADGSAAAKAKRLKVGKLTGTLLLRQAGDGRVVSDANEIISEKVGGVELEFRAGSFFQNNPFILPKLVEHVLNEALGTTTAPPSASTANDVSADSIEYLVDTYCGSGLFALAGARLFQKCAGVETAVVAVENARQNARRNGLENVEFLAGSAESIFKTLSFPSRHAAVVVDPPRKGCDVAFLTQLLDFAPRRIVYVSCSPDTQARDLKTLLSSGYVLKRITPFDLFPHTRHIEAIATLEWPEPSEAPTPTPLDDSDPRQRKEQRRPRRKHARKGTDRVGR
jgi:tRNA/tmRNA/rRNA uracil-C5-methylase (TrmA/RlmC/RlmD family)